jgi:ATP-dependent Clp protease protease subunit
MNANKAVELGFADGIIARENPNTEPDEDEEDEDEEEKDKNNPCENSVLFSRKAVNTALKNKLVKHYSKNVSRNTGTDITDLEKRLNLLKP